MDKNTTKITLEQTKKEELNPETSLSRYTVIISPYIHKRLDRHVLIIKKLIDKGLTKHHWLLEAIKEKLAAEKPYEEVPIANTITVKMDQKLDQSILERIHYVKKFRKSYSKKQWISDAIIDKLERDEEDVEKKLLEARPGQELGQQEDNRKNQTWGFQGYVEMMSDKEQIKLLKNELAELKALLQKN